MRRIIRDVLLTSLAATLWCSPASGQAVLNEEFFLKAADSSSSPGAADALALDAEAEGYRQRSLWPNPELGLDEQPSGNPGELERTMETTVVLSQKIPLFTYPSLRAQAAHGVAATGGKRSEATAKWRLAVRLAYAETLLRQEELAAIEITLASCRAMQDLMGERKRRGEASGLEEVRIGLEVENLVDRYEAALSSLRESKRSLLLASGAMAPTGEWSLQRGSEPQSPPISLEAARKLALASRGLLLEMRAQVALSDAERRGAVASSLPELSLYAGYKRAKDPTASQRGFVWGMGLSIPVFDRGQHRRSAAAARAGEADIRARLAESEVLSEVESAFNSYLRFRDRADSYESGLYVRAGRLAESAGLAFEAGEMTLLEYLDAVRASLDANLRRNTLKAACTKARLALEAATGAPQEALFAQALPPTDGGLQ